MNYYQIHVCENNTAHIEAKMNQGEEDPFDKPAAFGYKVVLENEIKVINHTKNGIFYDWLPGYCEAPFVLKHVRNRLIRILSQSVQWVGPFFVENHELYLFNCTNVVDCLNEGSSNNIFLLNQNKIKGHIIFRPKCFEKYLLVSEQFKDNIVNAGDTGIRFGKIADDGWITNPFKCLS